jgi:hypothetical protein
MINQYVQIIALVAIIGTAIGGLSMLMIGADHLQFLSQPAVQRQAIPVPGPTPIRPSSIDALRP